MRKTAAAILLAGFLFTTLTLPAAGIDLLIDAVGFLLLFNGARTLVKYGDRFALCPVFCLGLVVVSALQLFLSGALLAAADILRAAGETALYLLLWRGFAALPDVAGRPGRTLGVGVVFFLNALATPASALLTQAGIEAAVDPARVLLLAAHLALCLLLLWMTLVLTDVKQPSEEN